MGLGLGGMIIRSIHHTSHIPYTVLTRSAHRGRGFRARWVEIIVDMRLLARGGSCEGLSRRRLSDTCIPPVCYACEYLLTEKDDSRELDIGIWVAIYRYSTVYV